MQVHGEVTRGPGIRLSLTLLLFRACATLALVARTSNRHTHHHPAHTLPLHGRIRKGHSDSTSNILKLPAKITELEQGGETDNIKASTKPLQAFGNSGSSVDSEASRIEESIAKLRKSIASLEESSARILDDIEPLKQDIKRVKEDIERLKRDIERLQENIEQVDKTINAQTLILDSLSETERLMLQASTRKLETKEQQLAAKEQQLAAKEQQHATKQQQLATKEHQLAINGQHVLFDTQQLAAKEQQFQAKKQAAMQTTRTFVSRALRLSSEPLPAKSLSIFTIRQHFGTIRSMGAIYVDKTQAIQSVVEGVHTYALLLRPRRFGKSLLLSTFEAFYLGAYPLFRGLHLFSQTIEMRGPGGFVWCPMDASRHRFPPCPVINLDFSALTSAQTKNDLEMMMLERLNDIRANEGMQPFSGSLQGSLSGLIEALAKHPNNEWQRVVVLIDEYDSVLSKHRWDSTKFKELLSVYKDFLQVLKAQDSLILQCLATGVTSYAKSGLLSGANQFIDISYMPEYSSACGFTEHELGKLPKDLGLQDRLSNLRSQFNGYNFNIVENVETTNVYNPLFIARFVNSGGNIQDYWKQTTSESVFEGIARSNVPLLPVPISSSVLCSQEDNPAFNTVEGVSKFLLQAGYLTIKKTIGESVELDHPNMAIRNAIKSELFASKMRNYAGRDMSVLDSLDEALRKLHNITRFFEILNQEVMIPTSYQLSAGSLAKNYQIEVLRALSYMGMPYVSEIPNSVGRCDAQFECNGHAWIIEFKRETDSSRNFACLADEGLKQIDSRLYEYSAWGSKLNKNTLVHKVVAVGYEKTRCFAYLAIKRGATSADRVSLLSNEVLLAADAKKSKQGSETSAE